MTADRQHLITIPEVNYKGPYDTDASMFRIAARNLDNGRDIGGSNLRSAVTKLLLAAAEALESQPTKTAERSVCGECGELIYRNHPSQPWMHTDSQLPRCYRDPDTETAYPDPDFAISARGNAFIAEPDNIVDAEVVEDDDDYPVGSVSI